MPGRLLRHDGTGLLDMPRLQDAGGWRYDPERDGLDALLGLVLGPVEDGLTVEQLEVAWTVEGDRLMADCRRNPNPGWRPAGWWLFTAGEPRPEDGPAEALRLVELGELDGDELEAVRERAAEALGGIGAMDRAEDAGAVGPQGAGVRMRAGRDARAVVWREVLAALG